MTGENGIDTDKGNDQPWQLAEDVYLSADDSDTIFKSLERVRDNHEPMTLVSDDGQVFTGTLLLKINGGLLHIDKPLDWDGLRKPFRVFFHNIQNYWQFFWVEEHDQNPFSLSVKIPTTMYILQRRRYKRVVVPPGTRAMVKIGQDTVRTLYIRDISASGMLFCDSVPVDHYPIDDSFQDIMISVPQPQKTGGVATSRTVMPPIEKARVVRSFVDEDSCRSCYGISFEYESNHVREELCRLVRKVELAA